MLHPLRAENSIPSLLINLQSGQSTYLRLANLQQAFNYGRQTTHILTRENAQKHKASKAQILVKSHRRRREAAMVSLHGVNSCVADVYL